jgi:hypothetical protein
MNSADIADNTTRSTAMVFGTAVSQRYSLVPVRVLERLAAEQA